MIATAALILALRFATAAANPGELSCRLADERVETAIAAVVQELNGTEYCEYRRYCLGDVDGDGRDDLFVTFNVESPGGGGNNVLSYLLAFTTTRKGGTPLRLKVGERGQRYPDSISLDGKSILVHFMQWVPGDALCCPSATSKARFEVGSKSIKQKPGA